MNRIADIWDSRTAIALRRFVPALIRVLVRAMARLVAWLVWELRVIWARLSGRVRIAVGIGLLVLISAQTSSVAPSVSATVQALAVLLLAAVGFWMILTSPRRRRW